MHTHDHHEELMEGFLAEHKEIFDNSSQGIYVYLDEEFRVCNQKFANMLGYSSPEEWRDVDTQGSFPDAFVAEKSQETLVSAYQSAMEELAGSTIKVTWKKKSKGTVDTTVILVPIAYQDHLFALHFVSPK